MPLILAFYLICFNNLFCLIVLNFYHILKILTLIDMLFTKIMEVCIFSLRNAEEVYHPGFVLP